MSTVDSFGAKSTLTVGETDYEIFRIDSVAGYEKLRADTRTLDDRGERDRTLGP